MQHGSVVGQGVEDQQAPREANPPPDRALARLRGYWQRDQTAGPEFGDWRIHLLTNLHRRPTRAAPPLGSGRRPDIHLSGVDVISLCMTGRPAAQVVVTRADKARPTTALSITLPGLGMPAQGARRYMSVERVAVIRPMPVRTGNPKQRGIRLPYPPLHRTDAAGPHSTMTSDWFGSWRAGWTDWATSCAA